MRSRVPAVDRVIRTSTRPCAAAARHCTVINFTSHSVAHRAIAAVSAGWCKIAGCYTPPGVRPPQDDKSRESQTFDRSLTRPPKQLPWPAIVADVVVLLLLAGPSDRGHRRHGHLAGIVARVAAIAVARSGARASSWLRCDSGWSAARRSFPTCGRELGMRCRSTRKRCSAGRSR